MYHSLVTYYLHASLLKAPFTNVKGIRVQFVVCSQHCWPNITSLLCWTLLVPWICLLNCSDKQSLSVSVKTSQAGVYNWTADFTSSPCFAGRESMHLSSSAGRSQMMMVMIFGMEGSDFFRWKTAGIWSWTVSPQVTSATCKILKCNLWDVLNCSYRQKGDLAAQRGGIRSIKLPKYISHSIFSFLFGEASAWAKGYSSLCDFQPSFSVTWGEVKKTRLVKL